MFKEFGSYVVEERTSCHDALVELRDKLNEVNIIINYEAGDSWKKGQSRLNNALSKLDPSQWKGIVYTINPAIDSYNLMDNHHVDFILPMRVYIHPDLQEEISIDEFRNECMEKFNEVKEITAAATNNDMFLVSYYGGADECLKPTELQEVAENGNGQSQNSEEY